MAIPLRLDGSLRFGGVLLGAAMERSKFDAEFAPAREALRLLGLTVHRRLEELGARPEPGRRGFRRRLIAPATGPLAKLAPREREVIWLQLRGLALPDAARICAVSTQMVAEYSVRAYQKLGVQDRAEAARLVASAEKSAGIRMAMNA